MKLKLAQNIAESLKSKLAPYCERIEIGGSIRRKKPEPNDVELVCIPKFAEIGTGQIQLDGAASTVSTNLLSNELHQHFNVHKGGEKYFQIGVFDGQIIGHRQYINVDIFMATHTTWGYIFMLRTGPREFSKFVVTELKRRGFTPKGGAVWSGGEPIPTRDEGDVFHLLQIADIYPEYRFKEAFWK